MAYWLFKEEPTHYGYADLEKDGTATWDGVNNNLARQHLRKVQPGDRIFYYHTGDEKAVVGEMKAISAALPDPNGDDDKAVMVKVQPVRRLPAPVTLAQIKADAQLKEWELVRLPRLSVLPVTEKIWRRIEQMSKDNAH
jgi:predicted RNA-binding protein with PUA-like domain